MWYRGNKEGGTEECSVEEYIEFISDWENKVVKQEHVGKYWVSTVFLGLDHRDGGDGPPILFETMVFTDGDADEDTMVRYTTREEALIGHKVEVARLKGSKYE